MNEHLIEIAARGIENRNRAAIGLPSKSSPIMAVHTKRDVATAFQALTDAGFKVVPIEPTEAMLNASWGLTTGTAIERAKQHERQCDAYSAMLEASG